MSTVPVFKAGQEIEQIFREHYQFVYRTAYSVTGNVQDAEDVLQTIFTGLVRRDIPADLVKNPRAYLYRAAFNLSLNTIRSRKRQALHNDDVDAVSAIPSTSDSDAHDEMERRLYEAIAELQPRVAQIVVLRYAHGQSLAEIAKLLGTTRSSVAVSLFRARARLKKLIDVSLERKP